MNKGINDKHVIHKYYPPTEYSIDALINHYFWFSKREFQRKKIDEVKLSNKDFELTI